NQNLHFLGVKGAVGKSLDKPVHRDPPQIRLSGRRTNILITKSGIEAQFFRKIPPTAVALTVRPVMPLRSASWPSPGWAGVSLLQTYGDGLRCAGWRSTREGSLDRAKLRPGTPGSKPPTPTTTGSNISPGHKRDTRAGPVLQRIEIAEI